MLSRAAFKNSKFWQRDFLLLSWEFSSAKILNSWMQCTTALPTKNYAVVHCNRNSKILAQTFLLLKLEFFSAKILFFEMQYTTALPTKNYAVVYCNRNSKILDWSFFKLDTPKTLCHFFCFYVAVHDSIVLCCVYVSSYTKWLTISAYIFCLYSL